MALIIPTMANKPVHEDRLGHIKACVWKNETQNGVRHNVTIVRIYKDGDDWKETSSFGLAKLHLALDWQASPRFGAYLHAVARAEPSRGGGEELGVVEAYLHGELDLGATSALRLRLGHFLLPTSRENVEVAWSSPYTLSFSALNTWIGEEMRLSGLLSEVAWPLPRTAADELRLGASIYGGNDASGTLLAWRGWGMGDRITAFREVVPLPPLARAVSPRPC